MKAALCSAASENPTEIPGTIRRPVSASIQTATKTAPSLTRSFLPHFGISGIKEKMGYRRNGAISPFLKQGIKLSAALTYLSSRNAASATNLIHHLGALRVETPCRYISAMARVRDLSIREPLSNPGMMGIKGVCEFLTCGTSGVICPVDVRMVRALKPLRWPFRWPFRVDIRS